MPKLLVMALSLMLAGNTLAQKAFEGRIRYKVTYLSFPDGMEGVEMALPQEMTLLVSGASYRMQQSSALAGELLLIAQAGNDTLYQLFDFMGKKVFMATPQEAVPSRYRVVKKEGSKTIAGISCSQMFLQSAAGLHLNAWVDSRYSNPLILMYPSLNYLPLEFDMERNGIMMRLTAMEIIPEPLDDTYFTIPESAVRMSIDDLSKILK